MAAGAVDFTDLHRAREENYLALYTNARVIPYFHTVIIVFVIIVKYERLGASPTSALNHATLGFHPQAQMFEVQTIAPGVKGLKGNQLIFNLYT